MERGRSCQSVPGLDLGGAGFREHLQGHARGCAWSVDFDVLVPEARQRLGRLSQSLQIWRRLERAVRGVEEQCRKGRYPSDAPARTLLQGPCHGDDVRSEKPAFMPAIELIILAADAGEERLLSSQSLRSRRCFSRFFGIEDRPPRRRESSRAVRFALRNLDKVADMPELHARALRR